MNTVLPIRQSFPIWQIGAIFGALVLGGMIAILPIELAGALIVMGAVGILSVITPFSALAFALIVAPLRTLIQTESAINLPLDIGQLAFIFFVGAWVIHRIIHKKRLIEFAYTPLYIPIGIFFIVAGFGGFHATSLSAWLTEWLKWALILMLIYILFTLCRYNRRWEWLLFALISAGLGQATIGLYTFVGGSGADHLRIFADRGFFRAFGSFGQPNPFGGFMGLLTPLAMTLTVAYGLRAWSIWHKNRHIARFDAFLCGYYALASLLMSGAVIASWSRGAWLGLGVAILALVISFPRKLWQGLGLFAVVMVIGGLLWMSGRLPSSLTNRIGSATQELFVLSDVRGVDINPENYAVIERLAHWQAALNMGRANAWFGVGFGNYDATYEVYRLINWKFSLGHAHNYYLNVLAETGIIGLVAYIGLFVSLFMLTWQTRHHPDNLARLTAIGLLGSWVYLATHSMTDNLYVNNVFIHFGVMIGILAIIQQPLIRMKVKTP
jgi:putative inorganic carbon (hco3(-)) transporter